MCLEENRLSNNIWVLLARKMGRCILDKQPKVCATRDVELGMSEEGWGELRCRAGILSVHFPGFGEPWKVVERGCDLTKAEL